MALLTWERKFHVLYPADAWLTENDISISSPAPASFTSTARTAVTAGHVAHIPAEYPHGVWVADEATEPLVFAATGHPHRHVDAPNRMKV
jgi:hypothetical protein